MRCTPWMLAPAGEECADPAAAGGAAGDAPVLSLAGVLTESECLEAVTAALQVTDAAPNLGSHRHTPPHI